MIYDRDGRGAKEIRNVKILTLGKRLKTDSVYTKSVKRKKFRRRAAIKPSIGYLKSQFRMQQNCLHGEKASQIKALFAATALNLRKLMNKLSQKYFLKFSDNLFSKFNLGKLVDKE